MLAPYKELSLKMNSVFKGVVEVNRDEHAQWQASVLLDPLVQADPDSLGCLFGISNFAHFDPIASNRGLPTDASQYVNESLQHEEQPVATVTYVTAEELDCVDWDSNAEDRDSRISVMDESGEVIDKFLWSSPYEDVLTEYESELDDGQKIRIERDGEQLTIQRKRLTRKEALSDDWIFVLTEILPKLSAKFSQENVRIIAWFCE